MVCEKLKWCNHYHTKKKQCTHLFFKQFLRLKCPIMQVSYMTLCNCIVLQMFSYKILLEYTQILFQEVLKNNRTYSYEISNSKNSLKGLFLVFVILQMFFNLVSSFFVRNNNKRLCPNTFFSIFYIFFIMISRLLYPPDIFYILKSYQNYL